MFYPETLRVAHFPAADKQVEGEVMNPTRENYEFILEERGDLFKRIKSAALRVKEMRRHEIGVNNCKNSRNDDRGNNFCRPFPFWQENKKEPAGQDERVAYFENYFRRHGKILDFRFKISR